MFSIIMKTVEVFEYFSHVKFRIADISLDECKTAPSHGWRHSDLLMMRYTYAKKAA